MPLPHDASDADLVARIGRGDHAALDALVARHVDAIHDHVARWTGDADLAASATTAAFTDLLDDTVSGTAPNAVVPAMLRSARAHALAALEAGDRARTPVPPAVLAAAGPGGTTPADARAAWRAATGLGTPLFDVLDLHVRHGLDGHDLGVVLGLPTGTVGELIDDLTSRTDAATRAAYAGLTTVPAPVATRAAVTAAATTRVGRPPATIAVMRARAAGVVAGLALVVLGVGLAGALGERATTPTSGPATAAAEPVASPSPAVTPTPTPTLEPRPSPSVVPMASPEPTVPTSPSPEPLPSPSPTPSPSPAPAVLTVTIDAPASGATYEATQQDGDRAVATVPVLATVTGASEDTIMTWSSSVAPDQTLLTGASGDVRLWLTDPCLDTAHTLVVTARDEPSGQTAQAAVDVLVRETCEDPLSVQLLEPGEGDSFVATPTEGSHTVQFDVLAEANDDDLVWRWSAGGATVVAAPEGGSGTLSLRLDDCTIERDVTITVEVERPADESTAAAGPVTVTVGCPLG